MPLVFVLLLILLSVSAALTTGPRKGDQNRLELTATAVAGQMGWYHMQAVRQCSAAGGCPAGPIAVTTPADGATMSYAGSFRSATDGTTIVTTWVDGNGGNRLAGQNYRIAGLIVTALKDLSRSSAYAGAYNAADGTIGETRSYTFAGATTPAPEIAVPASVASELHMADGAPVLETPFR